MCTLVISLLLLLVTSTTTAAAAANIALGDCESKCGEVDVPYPFGTSYGCHRTGFKVTCDRAYQPPKLFLESDGPEVLDISVRNSTVRVRGAVWSFAAGNASDEQVIAVLPANLRPYVLSTARNSLVLVGCAFRADLRTIPSSQQGGGAPFGSCAPSCPTDEPHKLRYGRCDGVGCCQAPIPMGLTSFRVQFSWPDQNATAARPLWVTPNASVLTVEQEWWRDQQNVLEVKMSLLSTERAIGLVIPAVLDWALNKSSCAAAAKRSDFDCVSKNSKCLNSTSSAYGYICRCNDGNPYVPVLHCQTYYSVRQTKQQRVLKPSEAGGQASDIPTLNGFSDSAICWRRAAVEPIQQSDGEYAYK